MEYLGQPTLQFQGIECVVIHQPDGDKEEIEQLFQAHQKWKQSLR